MCVCALLTCPHRVCVCAAECAQAAHPDATGEQLRHIVKTLEVHAKAVGEDWWEEKDIPGWLDLFPDMGVFLDWGSIHQKDPALFDAMQTPEAKSEEELPAFLDDLEHGRAYYGGQAYENSRTEEEYAAFKRALHGTMDVWYAMRMRFFSPPAEPP